MLPPPTGYLDIRFVQLLMLPINKMNQRLPEAYKTEWLPAVLDYYF